jgi:hypothetical protein
LTAHAAHLDPDLLSAFLDRALPAREQARVEDHLAHCPGCRADLDGLARAVDALARLERAAPPPSLALRVERRAAVQSARRGRFQEVEARLSTFAPQSPLLVAFTMTIALATILYLYTLWAASPREPVLLRPVPAAAARTLLDRVEAGGDEEPLAAAEVEPDVAVELGASFRLRPGETAVVAGGEWRVRFVAVRGDSRCPVDVECVWAGSAEVAVETAGPDDPWVERSLHTGVEPRELRADGFTLALLDVEPAPRSTAPTDPARYVAVLQVDR